MLKFPNDSSQVTAYCDLCGNIVYSSSPTSSEENTWNQKNPHICKTYKIYCERCYMVPLLKIKELVTMLEQYEIKEEKKVRRRSKRIRIEKEKKKLEDIHNEFY